MQAAGSGPGARQAATLGAADGPGDAAEGVQPPAGLQSATVPQAAHQAPSPDAASPVAGGPALGSSAGVETHRAAPPDAALGALQQQPQQSQPCTPHLQLALGLGPLEAAGALPPPPSLPSADDTPAQGNSPSVGQPASATSSLELQELAHAGAVVVTLNVHPPEGQKNSTGVQSLATTQLKDQAPATTGDEASPAFIGKPARGRSVKPKEPEKRQPSQRRRREHGKSAETSQPAPPSEPPGTGRRLRSAVKPVPNRLDDSSGTMLLRTRSSAIMLDYSGFGQLSTSNILQLSWVHMQSKTALLSSNSMP